jgi:hypothetical protein
MFYRFYDTQLFFRKIASVCTLQTIMHKTCPGQSHSRAVLEHDLLCHFLYTHAAGIVSKVPYT